MLPNHIKDYLCQIAKSEGFTDFKIETTAGSKAGDNYLGTMIAATINGMKADNKSEKLNLICKVPPLNKIRNKNFNINEMFEREIYVYSKLLPAFVRFQQEKDLRDVDSFLSFPKVYINEFDADDGLHILIMEDLKSKRYEMWPIEKIIAFDHKMLVMRELGKFHAISLAMQDQRPEEFHEFKQLTDKYSVLLIKGKWRSFLNKSIERAISVVKNAEHKKLLQNFKSRFEEVIMEFVSGPSSKEFAVIGHGDCWSNNFLFQYGSEDNGNKILESFCLLDWQLTHYAPPVLDFMYTIFASTNGSFRKLHYESLLKTYYSSLSETIQKLGSNPNIYSFDQFQKQLNKFGEYALLRGIFTLQFKVTDSKDIGDLDEYAELVDRGEEADLLLPFDDAMKEKYSQLINDHINDLLKYGYVRPVA